MKKAIILFLFLFTTGLTFAQEYLVPLSTNPRLSEESTNIIKSTSIQSAPLTLPFIDDFSLPGIYPNSQNWTDRDVFINNDIGKYPPSQGVATFDALNDTGALYSNASTFPFLADYLSSQYINISGYTPGDSLYLSFFIQPGGRANAPETGDSLVLEFLEQYRADTLIDTTVTPNDTTFIDKWTSVWKAEGMETDTFFSLNHHWFKQIMVPVTDNIYFRDDFRFRFLNYASLASNNIPSWRSNADIWNLDYVYLNANRSIKDTLYDDLTLVNPAPNMLSRYTSMPLSQYLINPNLETRDSIEILISNLGNDTLICRYRFNVVDPSGIEVFNYDGGNYNLYPFYLTGYQNYPNHNKPKFPGFVYPSVSTDSAVFTVTHIIERVGISQELIRQNDTIRYHQRFYNYLAYDDGTAEAGYGLSPDGSMLAYRFRLNTPDTLRGIQFFFNRTLENASQRNFNLMIWADEGGKPGNVLYKSKKYLKPLYSDSLNKFYTYLLDTDDPLVLGNDNLTFYVGWLQQTDNNLNVGWDSTSNAQSNILFNVDGTWQNTSFHGALMIRPCLGPSLLPFKQIPVIGDDNHLNIYPNPTSGHFSITLPPPFAGYQDPAQYQLNIINLLGEVVAEYPYLTSYDLSYLPRGVYILRLNTTDNYLQYQGKVVLTK
ncbi:MAG: T9SS type A sorting domain-containing protein [Bacteroidales bacterium]